MYFQNKSNPQELILSLANFLSIYYGDRMITFKPNLEAIKINPLPLPLQYLYSFVGKYLGRCDGFLSANDNLLSLERINEQYQQPYNKENKLIFACENQGVWTCATEYEGIDPPVWIFTEHDKWKLCCNSLTDFLITFCLQEAIYSSQYSYRIESTNQLISLLEEAEWEVVTLWKGKYARDTYFEDIGYPDLQDYYSFYFVEDSILICSRRWCATNYRNANKLLLSLDLNLRKL